ncbi:hypothetical protein WJU16_19060 [Chitinophaga pollutisoli]|uniref:YD repeat-containing protein n=1 Tax=Chitinophaga pollutisoli TaxID=3133966 RepID=A0ABZ2YKI1_9BACT
MKTSNLLLLFAAIFIFSCSKKSDPPKPDEPPPPAPVANITKVVKGYLLKACDISLVPGGNFRINYQWNADSSLKKYSAVNPATQAETAVDFHYDNGMLSRISTQNSLSEGVYVFKDGKVDRITSRHLINPTGRNYYFTYNADGTVARIRYYLYNEAGEQLQQEVTYAWDASKRPTVITNTQPNGHVRIIRIEAWSDPFLFSPWIFSESEMDLENYELFNVPLLFHLDRMPSRFTEHTKPAGGTETLIRRWELNYTIQQEKLTFRRAQVTYIGDPQLNRTVEHTFHY